MALVSHEIRPESMDQKILSKLKYICQDFTSLDENEYVAHHSQLLVKACPICTPQQGRK